MEITLWAQKGRVSMIVKGDSNPNTPPTLTIQIKDPQITYDESTSTIVVSETK